MSGPLGSSQWMYSSGDFTIPYSCRFNDNDSAHLSRTPSSTTNRRTWTWSGWVKFTEEQAGTQPIFAAGDGNTYTRITLITSGNHLSVMEYNGEWAFSVKSSNFIRDFTNWYHIVVAVDTTQATDSNRVKMYINGAAVTSFFDNTWPSQNFDTEVNNNVAHYVARDPDDYLDCYQAEVHFIDGTALTASSFGETGDYGEWKPKAYDTADGAYGTNGFYLDFADSGNLGDDESGNTNDFTSNNLSAYDQVLDTPSNNFATLNPLREGYSSPVLSEGNLKFHVSGTNSYANAPSTIGMTSGKWYWESCLIIGDTGWGNNIGIHGNSVTRGQSDLPHSTYHPSITWEHHGSTSTLYQNSSSQQTSLTQPANGDIIGFALDMESGTKTLQFYLNGSTVGSAVTYLGDIAFAAATYNYSSNGHISNFGQDSSFAGAKTAQGNTDGGGIGDFYYTPPTGFLALCSANLPDPTVTPSEHFNTALYAGSASSQSITGVGFQPDFVWIKGRSSSVVHHALFDAVRGVNKWMLTASTAAEQTTTALTSFDTDGFSLAVQADVNHTSYSPYVAWNWKAGGSGSSNTDGDITSTVSVNQDAGFSIVTYTGSGTGGDTIGHGLSKSPEVTIIKKRSSTEDWICQSETILGHWNQNIRLNTAAAKATSTTFVTGVSSSLITLGTSTAVNGSSTTYVNYNFHSVDGYSKVGSFIGNGSTDGTYVHTGFRPAFVLIKGYSHGSWGAITNNKILGYNPDNNESYAGLTQAEATSDSLDYLSNGFKMRRTSGEDNGSGKSYIYLAFAEQPFKHTNAR